MCAAFDHAGHVYKQVKDAVGAHHSTIEQLAADVVVFYNDAITVLDAIKIDRGELEGNKDAALQIIDQGFNSLLRAIKQRGGGWCVEGACQECVRLKGRRFECPDYCTRRI